MVLQQNEPDSSAHDDGQFEDCNANGKKQMQNKRLSDQGQEMKCECGGVILIEAGVGYIRVRYDFPHAEGPGGVSARWW